MTWENELFRSAALGEAKGKLGPMAEQVIDSLIDEFNPDRQAAVVDETLRFRDWLRKYATSIEVIAPQKLHIGISVPLGAGQVQIALDADLMTLDDTTKEFGTARPLQVILTARSLVEQCFGIYKSLSKGDQPAPVAAAAAAPAPAAAAAGGDTATVTTLIINVVEGERRYKLKDAERFTKYGLTVYPEKVPEDWHELEPGSYKLTQPIKVRHDGKKVIDYV